MGVDEPVADAADGGSRDLQVLARVTRVLELFDHERSRVDLPYVTAKLGLNRSTTYRYLAAMEKHGMLVHTPGLGYALGPTLSRVGLLALDRLPLLDRADPVMRSLSEAAGETAVLSTWGGRGPLVARVHDEHSRFIRISVAVGSTLPITTAQGLVFLAHLGDGRALARALAGLDEPAREALLAQCALIRGSGIAISDASGDGLRGIAAPIWGVDGSLVATLALIGTISRMPVDRDDPRVKELARAARLLSQPGV